MSVAFKNTPLFHITTQIQGLSLGALQHSGFSGIAGIDTARLATEALLYTPADIKAVVQTAARRRVRTATEEHPPALSTDDVRQAMRQHTRSIKQDVGVALVQ